MKYIIKEIKMNDENAVQPSLAIFPKEILNSIFIHLASPKDLASCCLVNRHFNTILCEDDAIWEHQYLHLAKHFTPQNAPPPPRGIDFRPVASYRLACAQLHPFLCKYGDLGLRALFAWQRIHSWLDRNSPEIANTLRPGASESELDAANTQLDMTIPKALRVLYRVHDGQELEFDRNQDAMRAEVHPSMFWGLFGGYQFYSHIASTRMFPLRRAARLTLQFRERLDSWDDILFAASFNFKKLAQCYSNSDILIANQQVGELPFFATDEDFDRDEAVRCDAVKAAEDLNYPVLEKEFDSVLRWFERYAAALYADIYAIDTICPEMPDDSRGISLFPRKPPFAGIATTRGIRVRASSVYVPEVAQRDEGAGVGVGLLVFAYSIKFELLSEEEQRKDEGGYQSYHPPLRQVQLLERHWRIKDEDGNVVSEVDGEGVLGEQPVLVAGGAAYTYQSCISHKEVRSMEGSFTFVENTIAAPGARIEAVCPSFELNFHRPIF